MSNHVEQWRAVWYQAVARAWKDDRFKQALVRDARAAIRDTFNFELPDNLDLRVVESPQVPLLGSVQLGLPAKPANPTDEASSLAELARELSSSPLVCAC